MHHFKTLPPLYAANVSLTRYIHCCWRIISLRSPSTWQSLLMTWDLENYTPWMSAKVGLVVFFSDRMWVCKVGQKWVHSCEYMKHSLFLYYCSLIIVLFFMQATNYKPTFAILCMDICVCVLCLCIVFLMSIRAP